jgi:glycosyltransferase involved in cell wall biosynthesis
MTDQSAALPRQLTAPVIVDVAGAHTGGAARFKAELDGYLARSGREDVRVIGGSRRVAPAWLLRREMIRPSCGRHIALNNVGFVLSGSERWTLLRNALHFLTDGEMSQLDPSVRAASRRAGAVVRLAARRSDVLVAPTTHMAERVTRVLPYVRGRIRVRAHPVSADAIPDLPREPAILCPVLFSPYKQMTERLTELLAAIEATGDPAVTLRVTADRGELPDALAAHPRVEFVGRLGHGELRRLWGRSRAIYFPTGIESFGYPVAEARASGWPVIARATPQNREIGGSALCGFTPDDPASLADAVGRALTADVAPDPAPFDPEAYFGWLLGTPS